MSHRPILPPETIGMLGGGQLGRYALMAAATMGYRTIVLDPDPSAPAGVVAHEHLVAPYDDPAALERLGAECAVVTTEFENPPADALDALEVRTQVAPLPGAVRVAQDRIAEKRFLIDNGFPVGPYTVLDDTVLHDSGHADGADGIGAFADDEVVVKSARLGYDGKGQRRARGVSDVLGAWADLGGVPCVVERLLDLDTEVSVIVARNSGGDVTSWPVAENRHVDGILDLSIVPARVDAMLADRAVGLAMAIADALDYVGVLAVEMFVVDGELSVNELAPRPHNSGHWTIDASRTSQFEQQIRAVCGLGLGDTSMTAPAAAMVNVLGDLWADGAPDWTAVLADPAAKLHLYGKASARPGRKMGHVTTTATNAAAAADRALALRAAAHPGV